MEGIEHQSPSYKDVTTNQLRPESSPPTSSAEEVVNRSDLRESGPLDLSNNLIPLSLEDQN